MEGKSRRPRVGHTVQLRAAPGGPSAQASALSPSPPHPCPESQQQHPGDLCDLQSEPFCYTGGLPQCWGRRSELLGGSQWPQGASAGGPVNTTGHTSLSPSWWHLPRRGSGKWVCAKGGDRSSSSQADGCSPDCIYLGFRVLAGGEPSAHWCVQGHTAETGGSLHRSGGAQHRPAPGRQSPGHQSAHASPRLTRKPPALRPRDDITPWTSSRCSVIPTAAQRRGARMPPSRVTGTRPAPLTSAMRRTPHSRTRASDPGATLLRTRGRRQRGFLCFAIYHKSSTFNIKITIKHGTTPRGSNRHLRCVHTDLATTLLSNLLRLLLTIEGWERRVRGEGGCHTCTKGLIRPNLSGKRSLDDEATVRDAAQQHPENLAAHF